MIVDAASAVPIVQALTAIGTVLLAGKSAQLLHGGLGRKSRLRQEAANLSTLLDKLPKDSYGDAQLRASLQDVMFELAFLHEFPKANNRSKLVFSTLAMTLALAIWYWWSYSHPTLTAVHIPLFVLWFISFHIQSTTMINQAALSTTARGLFKYVDGQRGLFLSDRAPQSVLILHQPSIREVRERAEAIMKIAPDVSKVDATWTAWENTVTELNSRKRCPWYHRVSEIRMLAEIAAFFELIGPLRPKLDS
ncbi:Uncharacterised protein [Mycobacteroides abscessus subsp. abscessus]|uniref:hypothetical protein n=1 Tax=Mycobacteroides abscessus TaxID=36809 RepID=UPI0009290DC8|nr:hypothetical protein [Mycobacteroides abscessus]SIC49341.1 Uncharacterised protein [Mycobacteroides abscessus subsp. abscessus]SIH90293.1 Uncharacterised protein [Mycobacteroides abscessus subsp. abscessus]SIJ12210.1 Uncharacterised protein [Mycobacteroides abscessus subsp. abscessus]SIJ47416.1 Uncharacterised protein [Mycobacteroides abscessus subsp. abscessus]